VHEAQLEHLSLDVRESSPGAGDSVAALHQLVGGVLVSKEIDERGRLAVVPRGWGVKRGGLVAGGRFLRLEDVLDRATQNGRHLADLR